MSVASSLKAHAGEPGQPAFDAGDLEGGAEEFSYLPEDTP
jgi:hypothetical protein